MEWVAANGRPVGDLKWVGRGGPEGRFQRERISTRRGGRLSQGKSSPLGLTYG